MKSIIFIDDDKKRHKAFKDVVRVHTVDWLVHYVERSQLAIEMFRLTPYHIAFFDHDLGDASTLNGSMLATEVLSNPELCKPKRVIVHSSNPSGAANIVSKFRSEEIPVQWLLFDTVLRAIKAGPI